MRTVIGWGMVLGLLCGVSGCGSKQDRLIKDMIKDMNAMADILEKDDATSKNSEAKLNDLQKHMEETNKKLDELKLSEEEQKKLLEKHKDEMEKAVQRLGNAILK